MSHRIIVTPSIVEYCFMILYTIFLQTILDSDKQSVKWGNFIKFMSYKFEMKINSPKVKFL
jgi:hypothetical protein